MSKPQKKRRLNYKKIYRERLANMLLGKAEPRNARELAIWTEHLRKVNAKRIAALHNQAAISRPNKNAGKVVVIPPGAKI